MPASAGYDQRTINDRATRATAEQERRERRAAVDAAFQYYNGDQWHPLNLRDGQDHNVIINLCRQTVDRMVAFLFPKMPQLELVEGRSSADEKALKTTWERNGGVRLLTEMALSGGLSGHVFAKVVDQGRNEARLVNLDPRLVLRWWRRDDVAETLWYEIFYQTTGVIYRQDVVKMGPGRVDLGDGAFYQSDRTWWNILDWEYRRDWILLRQTPWPWELGPIVDWPHQGGLFSAYGRGEIEAPLRGLNDKLNAVASDVAKILHHHGSPRTVATGAREGEITKLDSGPDVMFTIPNPQAKVYNLEMQSDLGAAMGFVQLMERSFFSESRTVRQTGNVADMQRVTNLGLQALYYDQTGKNEQLRRNYEWGTQEITMRFQQVMRQDVQRPAVHWYPPLPQDPIQGVEFVERLRAMQMLDRESGAHMLNLDWDTVLERLQAESTDAVSLLAMERLAEQPAFGVSGALTRVNGNGSAN